MLRCNYFRIVLLFYALVFASGHKLGVNANVNPLSEVNIECNSNNIRVKIETGADFNGMIYPKGLSKNSTCLVEYNHAGSTVEYTLPLRSCNTMNHDINDGVEYFNTVVVQPHSRLVTNLGRGFHVRCRYETKNNTINSAVDAKSPKETLPAMPNCMMKIFKGRPEQHLVAEHVRIGDYLTMSIMIDEQDTYGIKVTNCIVKDGLNWQEEPLINNEGCAIEEDIMGNFQYSEDLTSAFVTYPAFRFPFTSSIYYSCQVKLCLKEKGGCDDVPPICDAAGNNVRRRRRKRQSGEIDSSGSLSDSRDRSTVVYSGLYVNEVDEEENDNPSQLSADTEEDFCLSTRKFAIGIAIAGLLLMLGVILLIACIVQRRRRRKGTSTTGSSIYSGPYSNHAYSRD